MNIEYKLSADWDRTSKIILYGFGGMTVDNIELLRKQYNIVCILDSNKEKCGNRFKGIEIKYVGDASNEIGAYKIVIMSAGYMADEIAEKLNEYGLIEYVDYCKFEEWMLETAWRREEKLYLLEVNTSITSRCTLSCKHCNMYMPYYKEHVEYNISDFQYNVELLFRYVDYLCQFTILGGEPLLNDQLEEMLSWVSSKYKERIGKISVISNGTLLPEKRLLETCARNNITFSISDYTDEVPYGARLAEVITLLKEAGVGYQVRKSIRWCDMGFPVYAFPVEKGKERNHMLNCGPAYHGLNDGKLYYCHCSWSANRCGLFSEKEGDYVELKLLSKETGKLDILRQCRGDISGGFVSLCSVCGGCGTDNDKFVKAAVQMGKDNA